MALPNHIPIATSDRRGGSIVHVTKSILRVFNLSGFDITARHFRGNVVSDQQLPHSNKSHTRIVDDLGEHTVRVIDLCERLQVDGLIRLHHRDYDLVEILREKYVHFNLEFTLNERGKRYAVLPIIRSGYRTESHQEEVLPILD